MTTQLLCAAGDATAKERWKPECAAKPALPNIAGRIVVIGEENATDEKIVLEKRRWGFELQALYIETLLFGDYLRYLPISMGFVLFALFILLIEGHPEVSTLQSFRACDPFERSPFRHHA